MSKLQNETEFNYLNLSGTNRLRIISELHTYYRTKINGNIVKLSSNNKSDPALAAGYHCETRNYVGVIDRVDGKVKIINLTNSLSKQIMAKPNIFKRDICIVANETNKPTHYYNIYFGDIEKNDEDEDQVIELCSNTLNDQLSKLARSRTPEQVLAELNMLKVDLNDDAKIILAKMSKDKKIHIILAQDENVEVRNELSKNISVGSEVRIFLSKFAQKAHAINVARYLVDNIGFKKGHIMNISKGLRSIESHVGIN